MQKTCAPASRVDNTVHKRSNCDRSHNDDAAARLLLATIFRRERDGLIGYLKKQVGPELACDMAQEVFLRAATSSQLSTLLNPKGFLYCIARNLLIDAARRQRCRIVTLPLNEAHDTRCAAEQEHQLEAADLRSCLDRALKDLPERTRTIFIMHRFDEMAYREIRHELDISMAAVEYHMMKALTHIRVKLAEAV